MAAGGTGGHLFPAQAIAKELEKEGNIDLHFAGCGLSSNRYFLKERFAFTDIGEACRTIKGMWHGLVNSFKLLRKQRPDLLIGFGSFHSFPLLVTAVVLRIPFVLFESNAHPGKVNRLFSCCARYTAVQFSGAEARLFGSVIPVSVPLWEKGEVVSCDRNEALSYFGLLQGRRTLLVFGGSQGALAINKLIVQALNAQESLQIVHLIGSKEDPAPFIAHYAASNILACVKQFETEMRSAWLVADLAICRSGAVTVMEALAFEVPMILIPFPYATDDHQTKNALFMEKIGAAIHCGQKEITADLLQKMITTTLEPKNLALKKEAIIAFKKEVNKIPLSKLIKNTLCNKPTILSESAELG